PGTGISARDLPEVSGTRQHSPSSTLLSQREADDSHTGGAIRLPQSRLDIAGISQPTFDAQKSNLGRSFCLRAAPDSHRGDSWPSSQNPGTSTCGATVGSLHPQPSRRIYYLGTVHAESTTD